MMSGLPECRLKYLLKKEFMPHRSRNVFVRYVFAIFQAEFSRFGKYKKTGDVTAHKCYNKKTIAPGRQKDKGWRKQATKERGEMA